jgi:dTDP-4-amino-4,6-dideoxygalactose transaminase
LDEWNERRVRLAERYREAMSGMPLSMLRIPEWADPVWHLFSVRHPRRDLIQSELKAAGIDTIIHYPVPPHRQQAYASLEIPEGALPITERIHRETLSLPLGPQMKEDEQARVIEAIRHVVQRL